MHPQIAHDCRKGSEANGDSNTKPHDASVTPLGCKHPSQSAVSQKSKDSAQGQEYPCPYSSNSFRVTKDLSPQAKAPAVHDYQGV
jgi:hypothetical protein